MFLRVRSALKSEIESNWESRGGVEVGYFEILIDRVGGNYGAKEIVAVSRRSEARRNTWCDLHERQ